LRWNFPDALCQQYYFSQLAYGFLGWRLSVSVDLGPRLYNLVGLEDPTASKLCQSSRNYEKNEPFAQQVLFAVVLF